jgi:hypothetical protein
MRGLDNVELLRTAAAPVKINKAALKALRRDKMKEPPVPASRTKCKI